MRHIPYTPIVRLITLVPHVDKVFAKYLYFWLKNLHIIGTGTTQQQLTVTDLKKTEILVAATDVMQSFTNMINPLFEKIWTNQRENRMMVDIRYNLLFKLMCGEIDISSIKI